MKKINKNILKYFALLFVVGMISCDDYLEYNEMKADNEDLIWSEFQNIRDANYGVYNAIPSTFQSVGGAFLDCATDNAEDSKAFAGIEYFNMGTWDMFTNPDNVWSKNYRGIYNANKFIESADTVDLYNYKWNTDQYEDNMKELRSFRGEARFLRAYYYFELIKRYGGVPIIETTTSIDYNNSQEIARNTYKECTDFITSQCDSAMKYLDKKKDLGSAAFGGRVYYDVALALKSRAFLYAASELNNTDGSMDAYYDSCAVASAELFNMGYTLNGVDYNDLFTPTNMTHEVNNEVIFDIRSGNSLALEKGNYPVGFRQAKGETNPSQNLIDAYEMKDGSAFDWNNPEHAADPYSNRDARFAATVVYNGMNFGSRAVETYEGGLDAGGQINWYGTKTGYYLKKFIDTGLDLETANGSKHVWFLFRYAEILFNYAEAMNELYGPNEDPKGYGKTAIQALNEVRSRAGQPAFSTDDVNEFRTKVRNERRIELAFEDHRWFDVRRWKIAEETLGAPLNGVKIQKSVNEVTEEVSFSYEIIEVEERVFEDKMYRYPIPANEVLNSNGIEQNPGW